MSLTLAIDQGTRSSRAAMFDERGRMLAHSQAPVDLQVLSPTEVEQSPEDILMSVEQVISDVLSQASTGTGAIRQAGLATQRSSVLAWERSSGRALTPVLSWQDTRMRSALDAWRTHAEHIRRQTGLPLSPHYGAAKLHWLLQRNEAVCRARERDDLVIGPLASFLLHHLAGASQDTVDDANASRTLLWSLEQRNWDPGLCSLFGIPIELLPACRPTCSEFGRMVSAGIPLTAMNGDQPAALYAHGLPGEDTILANIGTGAFVLLPTGNKAQPHPELLTGISRSYAARGEYHLEGTVNGAGAAVQWAEQRYALTDWQARLPHWLETIGAPPVFLNTVGGLGSPWWSRGPATGFLDVDDPETVAPDHALVAVIESIAFLLCTNIERLLVRQPSCTRIRISGGLSRLDGLCRRIASLSGLEVTRPSRVETTARGIAWLAAGGPDTWAPAGAASYFRPQPDPALEQRYRRFLDAIERSV